MASSPGTAEGRQERFLLLGGLGFLGSRLAANLSRRGGVTVTTRCLNATRGQWLSQYGDRIDVAIFDSARHALPSVQGGYDWIVNLATPSARQASTSPDAAEWARRSVSAALELLKRSEQCRLIHVSSFHVYGAQPGKSLYREDDSLLPTTSYGTIHLRSEETILADPATGGRTVILRPTNVVGSPAHRDLGDQQSLIFLDLCRQAATDGTLGLRTDGLGQRDFIAMGDFLSAVETVCSCFDRVASPLNVSNGSSMSLLALAQAIQAVAGRRSGTPVPLHVGSATDPLSRPFQVENRRLRELGWSPSCDLESEIDETLRFFAGP